MPRLLNSYLRYARGEAGRFSPWQGLNIFGALLRPVVGVRNAFFDRGLFCSIDPPIPVISVGNICHGGTNKTPMVEMLARRLMDCGLSVGIVSRGYGGDSKTPLWIGQDRWSSDRSATGDEPLMLARRIPEAKVVVSRDRYDGVRLLQRLGVDIAVADDAFQHRRMGRDLDIVLVDATCPFGNGKMFPAGILREHPEALQRADLVVLTKADQADPETVARIRDELSRWTPAERIFSARIQLDGWLVRDRDETLPFVPEWGQQVPEGKFVTFSAIGNPDSFHGFLASMGLTVLKNYAYRDHHRFTWADIDFLERGAKELGATAFVCTEKDLQNMPEDATMLLPLYIPRISVAVDRAEAFWHALVEHLRPRFVVASNGHGEDSIGALLADRLHRRFPSARVVAFPLVGRGKEYEDRGIEVVSPPSEMPSGGIVKYSFRDLFRDLRHGLYRQIRGQIGTWRRLRGQYRTPICVGDIYLLAHTLWGAGLTPALVATAKSTKLHGHLRAERWLMRARTRAVWTRDAETAWELKQHGVRAFFAGNPIMDLALEADADADPWGGLEGPRVMLLPGSRPRAYRDIGLLLSAVERISQTMDCSYVMVVAPTIEKDRLIAEAGRGGRVGEDAISVGNAVVRLYDGPIAAVAYGADLLIGLGGTANQVSAGLGVPVLSIIEKGKLVQKKLLQDAELLVDATPEALADAAVALIRDPVRRHEMARAGIELLGGPGTANAVAAFVAGELGWEVRCRVYERLAMKYCGGTGDDGDEARSDASGRKGDVDWEMSREAKEKMLRLVKILKERSVR
jgi:tetraacyldisaccharide 4''-kinase